MLSRLRTTLADFFSSLYCLHRLRAEQQQLAGHVRMYRAPELISARPRHVESNDCIPFRVEKYSAQASAIDDHSVLLDLSRKTLEHGRAKVVPFGILVPDLNRCRES